MAPMGVQEEGEDGRGEPDDELDDMGVPRGWRECPPMGRPIERFLPMKVPLGAHFDRVIAPEHRFHVDAALEAAHAALAGLTYPLPQLDEAGRPVVDAQGRPLRVDVAPHLGLVIDLTRSSRYYDKQLWLERGVKYVKVGQGRGWQGRGQAAPARRCRMQCRAATAGDGAAAALAPWCLSPPPLLACPPPADSLPGAGCGA